ncbi:MAG: IPT/TIG domain-containing protein [Acidobacteriota bacterium]|nr:IPT/TIG domain-containing protein [Acidobacteriota bacterium]
MIRTKLLIAAVLLFAGTLASADVPLPAYSISTEPVDPTSLEPVTLIVAEFDSCPPPPTFTRNGFDIRVEWIDGPCLSPPTLVTRRFALGVLAPGTYTVTVTRNTQTRVFTFVVQPADEFIVNVDPSLGPTTGGTRVNITASPGGTIPPQITFGGVPATDIEVIDNGHFRATTPPHAAGAVEVRVGRLASYTFRYYDPNDLPSQLFERVLIPVVYNGPGAFNSEWRTEITVRNETTAPVELGRPVGSARVFTPLVPAQLNVPNSNGVFLFVPREASATLRINALVRDISREAQDLGTEIPIARESDFASAVGLLNIPVDTRFRRTLRIYTLGEGETRARVITYSLDNGLTIDDRLVTFTGSRTIDLDNSLRLPTSGRVGIRVEKFNAPNVWAFVTITNNETQHVTVVSPQ